jgi:murein DD-endopeptidase MepM/ murein hydrolase activator NlpD
MGGALAWIVGAIAAVVLIVGGFFAGLAGSLAIDTAEKAPTIPPEVEATYRQVALRTGVHWAALAAWDGAANGFDLPLPTLAEILGELIEDLLDEKRREAEEYCLQNPNDQSRCPPEPPDLTPSEEGRLWRRAHSRWRSQLTSYVEAHAAALSVAEFEKAPEVVYARFLSRSEAAKSAELLEGFLVLETIQVDADEILIIPSEPPEGWTPGEGFAWPVVAPISSRFGPRVSPIDGVRRLHAGIDLSVVTGTPIRATEAGTVTAARWDDTYGLMVTVDHGDGYTSLYAHGSALAVNVGQPVSQGQVVLHSGSTGRSTGPHLHFEIHYQGVPVDPLLLLTERPRGG